MNNIGISVNDKFIDGALTLIFSIKKHNSFDFKLYVVDIDISKTNKLLLKRLHSDIEFVSIPDKELYLSKIVLSTPQDNSNDLCIRDGFYRFELFKLPIEKIVYLDCDMLCLGNIEELFNLKEQFSACYIETPHQIQGKLQDIKSLFHFNTGMMVIGEKYLGNTNYYNELVSLISNFVPPNDETILNYFFSCKNDINYINYKYNTPLYFLKELNNECITRLIETNFIAILHFGPAHTFLKPWDNTKSDNLLYKSWVYYHNDMLKYIALA